MAPWLVPMEMLDQVWVQDECNDYELSHLTGASVHQYVWREDEYVQY